MSNSNTTTKNKDRSYSEIKDSTIKKIVTHASDLRVDLIEMIKALRAEKKDRAAVTQQLKNDFVIPKYLSKSFVLGIIREDYDALSPLEKEKKKIMIAAGTGDQMMDDNDTGTGTGSTGGEGEEDDIITKREKAKQDMLTKSIKKGSSQMPKLKPTVNSSELENDDDSEEEAEETFDDDDTISTNVLKDVNNIVIDDLEHLKEIKDVIVQGYAVVIEVDKNLMLLGISKGKKF